ncbi:hypothetical protein HRbin20_01066 [bacterium HR20]|nr:hypothetical protein HRbin20_01066 [bacterium HR20]
MPCTVEQYTCWADLELLHVQREESELSRSIDRHSESAADKLCIPGCAGTADGNAGKRHANGIIEGWNVERTAATDCAG